MNDFLDCCMGACAERDSARLEADRLRAELARLAKERDEAVADLAIFREDREKLLESYGRLQRRYDEARLAPATTPAPWPGKAEVFEGLELIEGLIAGTHRDAPGTDLCDQCDPWQRLARVGLIAGRLIAAAR